MLTEFACPVCGAHDWGAGEPFRYRLGELPEKLKPAKRDYLALRQRVLFELWFPGRSEVTLAAQYCNRCGFMCYAPRPEARDLLAKYGFLGHHEHTGAAQGLDPKEAQYDRLRAERSFRLLTSGHARARTVLDVGGGDGRLLAPFLEAGLECSILDFNPQPVAGVRRLGATWADLPPDARFDLVICSHVLEHVADPVGFARELLAHLAPGGIAYVEIPFEIWKSIPIEHDPVTHVNFFTRRSLGNALRAAGGTIIASRTIGGTYGQWKRPVAWALVRPRPPAQVPRIDRAGPQTRRLLTAAGRTRLWRRLILEPQLDGRLDRWRSIPRRAWRKLTRVAQ